MKKVYYFYIYFNYILLNMGFLYGILTWGVLKIMEKYLIFRYFINTDEDKEKYKNIVYILTIVLPLVILIFLLFKQVGKL